MSRPRTFRLAALTLANILLPIAVLIFATGFFPYKPFFPGLADWEDVAEPGGIDARDMRAGGGGGGGGEGGSNALAQQPEPVFDRVVFMVVDALRSDFVFGHGSGFEFVQSLIRDGAAIPFTAHATPPTVTMPRVKALTTGSVPSFLDLILNFAESDTSSSLATQDTWLAQLRAARNGKLVFYGDDTWLKLFPPRPSSTEAGAAEVGSGAAGEPFWLRHDGTSSFFVSDFTEVDHNVTRHLPSELARADWNAMVLHYLGLDHIGHKTGPQGPNMLPKQREMDSIVRMIYEAMESQPQHARTLLVLAGDHGMNAGGNHGGSGPGETEPALVFASPRFQHTTKREQYECPTLPREDTEFHFYTKVGQSDIVPTLAGLLGMPVSKNSLGVLIREVRGVWTGQEMVRLLRQNARQLVTVVRAKYGAEWFEGRVEGFLARLKDGGVEEPDDDADLLAFLWAGLLRHSTAFEHLAEKDIQRYETEYYRFLLAAQKAMSDTASSYDIPRMVLGMGLTGVALVAAVLAFPSLWPPTSAGMFFALTALLYGVMMFASSYVEEEQRFWYWITPAWIALLACTKLRSEASPLPAREGEGARRQRATTTALAIFALLTTHRLCVRWNQTGQKHAGAPDIVHAFFPAHHVLLWLLVLATYLLQAFLLHRRTFAGIVAPELAAVVASGIVLVAVVFKLNFTQADAPELVLGLEEGVRGWTAQWSLVAQARAVFGSLALAALGTVVGSFMKAGNSGERQRDGASVSLTERLHHLLTLFLMTQTRAPNVPLFALLEIQRAALGVLLAPPSTCSTTGRSSRALQTATSALLLSHTSFFCTGGSNSISSIDLSNAYNGVADYNIAAVGLLLFAGNWAGPVWWCSAAVLLMRRTTTEIGKEGDGAERGGTTAGREREWVLREREKLRRDVSAVGKAGPRTAGLADSAEEEEEEEDWPSYLACMTAFVAAGLVAVMAACTVLRTHLFIWTVFSPKFLYAMAWSAGWHFVVNVGVGSLLWGVGRAC